MDLETFITAVFCVTDDFVSDFSTDQKLRQRGPAPLLADSEVITIEVVGEFLGIDTDAGLYRQFRRHYAHLFPTLMAVHRTTFLRQAANLWATKHALWQSFVAEFKNGVKDGPQQDPRLTILDSMPLPVCRFARAYRCRLFQGAASFGRDETARQTFYGFRLHMQITDHSTLTWPGVITSVELAPANASDVALAPEVLAGATGQALVGRNYWSPVLKAQLATAGLNLVAPFRSAKGETATGERRPWPRWLIHTRRRIETVLGHPVERNHAKRVWARDRWHLSSRWWRKVLSHTMVVLLCETFRIEPLSFARLLTD